MLVDVIFLFLSKLGMWAHLLSCQDYQDLLDRGWRRYQQLSFFQVYFNSRLRNERIDNPAIVCLFYTAPSLLFPNMLKQETLKLRFLVSFKFLLRLLSIAHGIKHHKQRIIYRIFADKEI